jgi:hypothetical protein
MSSAKLSSENYPPLMARKSCCCCRVYSHADETPRIELCKLALKFFSSTRERETSTKGVAHEENSETYDINELHKSQSESHVDFLGHVLYGSNEFVVASEEVSHQPLLILAGIH